MSEAERNTTIDFWRGLVLVVIFVNHIPGNWIENLTPRNFGFSDAAEAFIFISGLSVALVYYPRIPQGDGWLVIKRCVGRAFELYRVHLLLTASAIALFSIGYELSHDAGLLEADGRSAVFGDTAKGVTGILTLGHQLGYFNILPLYIALMLWAPVALLLVRVHAGLALGVSGLIYILARAGVLAFPNWPEPGTWFFNPFAWQLLFTIGMVIGAVWAGRRVSIHGLGMTATSAFLAASLVIGTDAFGRAPGLLDSAFGPFDLQKHDLGLGRLLHFLALAYVVVGSRMGDALKTTFVGPDLMRLGRNGLMIFAGGSLLSALGQVTMTLAEVRSSASPHLIGMIFTLLGIVVLLGLARYLEWNKSSAGGPRKDRPAAIALSSAASGPSSS